MSFLDFFKPKVYLTDEQFNQLVHGKEYTNDILQLGHNPLSNNPKFNKSDLLKANIGHIAAGIDTICKAVARNRFYVKMEQDGRDEKLLDHPFSLLMEQPNDDHTPYESTYELVNQLLWSGDAYYYRQPDGTLYLLPSDQVEIIKSSTEYISGYKVRAVREQIFSRDEIVHFRFPSTDKKTLYGQSIIEKMYFQANIYRYQMSSEEALHKNDSVPSMYMSTKDELTKDQRDEIGRAMAQKFKRGGTEYKGVMVAHRDLKLIPLKWSPVETQFLESKAWNAKEIYALMGFSPSIRGMIESGHNRATADVLYTQFLREVVNPILMLVSQKWSMEFKKLFENDYKRGLRVGYDKSQLSLLDRQQDHLELVDAFDRGAISLEYYQQVKGYPAYKPVIEEPKKSLSIKTNKKLNGIQEQYRAQVDRKTRRVERKFANRLKPLFSKIEDYVLDRIKDIRKNINDELSFELSQFADESFTISAQFIGEAHKLGFEHILRFWDLEGSYPVGSLELQQIIAGRESLIKQSITKTLREQLKNEIIRSNDLGEDFDELVARIKNLGLSNAERIATTEITQAFNEGVMQSGREAGLKKKRWITMNDSRVREDHIRAQNEGAIDINQDFKSTGLSYPSEPNCRCTVMLEE